MFITKERNVSCIPWENCGNTGILFLVFVKFVLLFLSTLNALVKYSKIIGSLHTHINLHTPFCSGSLELLKGKWLQSWLLWKKAISFFVLHLPPSVLIILWSQRGCYRLTLFFKPASSFTTMIFWNLIQSRSWVGNNFRNSKKINNSIKYGSILKLDKSYWLLDLNQTFLWILTTNLESEEEWEAKQGKN